MTKQLILDMIDEGLASMSGRVLVSTNEMADLLLDLRQAAAMLPDDEITDDLDRVLGVGAEA